MSQNDKEQDLSVTGVEQTFGGESDKLVPVSESIRYRRRAQSAEKKAELLAEELAEAKSEAARTSEELQSIRLEQRLTHKLTAAGSVDLEVAMLIAKARLGTEKDYDLDDVVEQLKREKQYLFAEPGPRTATTKTAAAKDRMGGGQTVLENAAKKAATTGNRADLQEYLKLRRNFS